MLAMKSNITKYYATDESMIIYILVKLLLTLIKFVCFTLENVSHLDYINLLPLINATVCYAK